MSLLTSIDSGISNVSSNSNQRLDSITHLSENSFESYELTNRVYYFVKSWFNELCYTATTPLVTLQEYMAGPPAEYVVPNEKNTWDTENKGLYVVIHGLNGRPNIWRKQLTLLQKHQPEHEVRLPYVPKKGNCPLEEAVQPIELMIRDYIQNHPKKPICLLGVSNGARIAAELEIRLRNTSTPIKVSCIAGVLSGTKQLDLMNQLGLAKRIYAASLVDELLYQSKTATQLMNRMREALKSGIERSYDFYASPNDFQISPFTGSFPVLPGKETNYFLVPGENHNSIVSRVSEMQINRCIEWMKNI